MDQAFLFFPCLEGDSWIRADQIVGFYRKPGWTRTEVHLANGEITLTDLSVTTCLRKIQKVWAHA